MGVNADDKLGSQMYDPEKVNMLVGNFPIVGFADGTFIKISRNTETFKQHVGAKGAVDYTKSADKTGKITFTLKHTSPSNYLLASCLKANEQGKLFSVVFNDLNITLGGAQSSPKLGMYVDCVIEKPADEERGTDISSREWTVLFAKNTFNESDLLRISAVIGGKASAQSQPQS